MQVDIYKNRHIAWDTCVPSASFIYSIGVNAELKADKNAADCGENT